jgi:hypothetical protein
MNDGISLVKSGNDWKLLISRTLTYEEFEACMKKLLSSPTTPNTIVVHGQEWSFADLSNKQARMLLYQSL